MRVSLEPRASTVLAVASEAVVVPQRGLIAAMAPLTAGHLATDFAQGALPALLPYLVTRFHLSYLEAGTVVLFATFANSIVQPLFGHWSDRRGATWLLPAGPIAAGVGISLLSIAPSFPVALVFVVIAGLGVAAYHPEATKHAAWIARDRPSTAMSIFSIGGNLGVALGPLVAGFIAARYGLHGAALLVIPGALVGGLMLASLPRLAIDGEEGEARAATSNSADDRPRELAILLTAVAARGYVYFALVSFVPLLEQRVRHHGADHGSRVLTLLLATGAAATLVFGPLGDRIGRRNMLLWSFVLCIPATVLYLANDGWPGLIGLAVAGACLVSSFGVTIVLSQEYLPSRMGTAAGLSVGFSIGLGGIAAIGVGALADTFGLGAALWTTPFGAGLGAALTLLLPADS
jgi:FSR family fosmidomycin resistance protein-like MFS transporter